MHFLPWHADAADDIDPDLPACEQEIEVVYARHADFVWNSLQRLGVPASELEDAFQEVFVVVHRRLSSFEGRSKLTTWLFGICLRIAQRQRRLSLLRSHLTKQHHDPVCDLTPEQAVQQHQAQLQLERLLGRLAPELRAVFVMFELENLDCVEIGRALGIPLGTAYSRLHAARARFRQEQQRLFGEPSNGGRHD